MGPLDQLLFVFPWPCDTSRTEFLVLLRMLAPWFAQTIISHCSKNNDVDRQARKLRESRTWVSSEIVGPELLSG